MEKGYAIKMKNCGVKTFNLGIKRNLHAYDCEMLSLERQARREANHIRAKKASIILDRKSNLNFRGQN
jgi:hypothetical protein